MRFRAPLSSPARTSAATSRNVSGQAPSSGLTLILEWSALLVVALTVCILPWLLGGVIPKARLVLQVGAGAAAVLTLLARLVAFRAFAMPPLGTWLLLGMAAIGILQLQPWLPPAVSLMDHAVHPEFRVHLPDAHAVSADGHVMKRTPADSRSVAPAMTRRHIAQWIAVAVLLCVVADSLSRTSQLIWMLGSTCMNAGVLTMLSFQQLFNKGSRGLCEPWMISKTVPFGSFVNPNNASGWLLVHVAMAIGLAVLFWGKNPSTGWSRSFQRPKFRDQIHEAIEIVRYRIAFLNSIQILTLILVVLLLTGVAATLSRAGIIAGIASLIVCAGSRMQFRKSLLLLVPFSILLLTVSVFLIAFELDTLVRAELMTLKDPVSESTSRLLHWSDSLRAVRDFPVLGSGQGGYAWSTLPYQRRGSSWWFMNADNQYVEILVESGIAGFVLFAGFGILLATQSMRLIRGKSRTATPHRLWSHRIAIGLAGVAMISSQSMAAFFDFGIGLSSTAAAIAVFGGILSAVKRSQPAAVETQPAWYAMEGGFVSWVLRLAMVAATATAIPELHQADKAYPAIVESARLFDASVTRKAFERLPALNLQLTQALKTCPDDLIVRNSLAKVLEAQFRLRIIDALSDSGNPPDDKQLQVAWKQLTPLGMADYIVMLKHNAAPERLQTLLTTHSNEFPWHKLASETSRQFPLTPGPAVDNAAGSLCMGELDDLKLQNLNAVRFTNPSIAELLHQSGLVCLISNHPDEAIGFWIQSLHASESRRVQILSDALRVWTPDQAIEKFAPEEYAATVRAAFAMSEPELKERLWKLAEIQWPSVAANPAADERVQRACFLQQRESPEVSLAWIGECLAEFPEMLELRRMRAETLEELGKIDEAIGEWARYEYYAPTSTLPPASIQRLLKAKHKEFKKGAGHQ